MSLIPTDSIKKALDLLGDRRALIEEMERIEKISNDSSVVKVAPNRDRPQWDGMFSTAIEVTDLVNLAAIRQYLWDDVRERIKKIDEELAGLGFSVNAT